VNKNKFTVQVFQYYAFGLLAHCGRFST